MYGRVELVLVGAGRSDDRFAGGAQVDTAQDGYSHTAVAQLHPPAQGG